METAATRLSGFFEGPSAISPSSAEVFFDDVSGVCDLSGFSPEDSEAVDFLGEDAVDSSAVGFLSGSDFSPDEDFLVEEEEEKSCPEEDFLEAVSVLLPDVDFFEEEGDVCEDVDFLEEDSDVFFDSGFVDFLVSPDAAMIELTAKTPRNKIKRFIG